ncbi:hypothetical protein [Streptomyces sp. NPDC001985]|uniref:hypothetical protein n=1 Tax=Streptomyces sp. NPDC001985 TaxID=3154406 RepID=UPI00331E8AAD
MSDFPPDLLEAQTRLHRARAEHQALCQGLPWSAEPLDGWEDTRQLYPTYTSARAASPGWSEEQRAGDARLRGPVLDLFVTVSTHPYWASLPAGEVVGRRMELKRDTAAGAEGRADESAPASA